MQEEIARLQRELDELKARAERPFEKGEWIVGQGMSGRWLMRLDHEDESRKDRYWATEAIFPDDGGYSEVDPGYLDLPDARRATKAEIEWGLRAVWARRCKEAGWDDPGEAEIELNAQGSKAAINNGRLNSVYCPQSDNLWTKNGRVYSKGRWATPKPNKGVKPGDWVIAKPTACRESAPEQLGRVVEVGLVGFRVDYTVSDSSVFSGSYVLSEVKRHATPDEIEEALQAEARRRGFEHGVVYECLAAKNFKYTYCAGDVKQFSREAQVKQCGDLAYNEDTDTLCENGYGGPHPIYHQGQWAELREERIEVNGYEAEFHKGYVQFGCAKIDNRVLREMAEVPVRKYDGNRAVTGIKIGDGVFSMMQLHKIVTRLRD